MARSVAAQDHPRARYKNAKQVCFQLRKNRATWAPGASSIPILEWVLNQIGAKHRRAALCRPAGCGVDRGRPADVAASGAAQAVSGRGAGFILSAADPAGRHSTAFEPRRDGRTSGRRGT